MIELRFPPGPTVPIRFALHPLAELVHGLYNVLHGLRAGDPCAENHLLALSEAQRQLLSAVIHSSGYMPDFLIPAVVHGQDFCALLSAVRATPPERVEEEAHRRWPEQALPAALRAPPADLRDALADCLEALWMDGFKNYWEDVAPELETAIQQRATALAMGRHRTVLDHIHPRCQSVDGGLVVFKSRSALLGGQPPRAVYPIDDRGLVLIPSYTLWPRISVSFDGPDPTTLMFGTRTFAVRPAPGQNEALSLALGAQRSAVLTSLVRPRSCADVATTLELKTATASYHLLQLKACGLVDAERQGRGVLYRLTNRGLSLLELFSEGGP